MTRRSVRHDRRSVKGLNISQKEEKLTIRFNAEGWKHSDSRFLELMCDLVVDDYDEDKPAIMLKEALYLYSLKHYGEESTNRMWDLMREDVGESEDKASLKPQTP